MDTKLIVSASPHLRSEETTAGLMANVIVALTPCVVASAIIFGPVSYTHLRAHET